MTPSKIQSKYEKRLKSVFNAVGFVQPVKIADTLQGSIWRVLHEKLAHNVAVKVTNKTLHSQSSAIVDGSTFNVFEDIISETNILKYLTGNKAIKSSPDSIVKYIGSFQTDTNYYLFMENGGLSLFNMVVKVHECIINGQIEISEWHKMVKIIFKQMIESIEYIHSKNVCHLDISLENFLINDVDVEVEQNENGDKLTFCDDNNIQIKICDFGLAAYFGKDSKFKCCKYCGKTQYKSPEVYQKKRFEAKKNDIWSLGVCLFMMILGGSPWSVPSKKCGSFAQIMNGNLIQILIAWDRIHYVNKDLIALFQSIFKYEDKRCSLSTIKKCKWLME